MRALKQLRRAAGTFPVFMSALLLAHVFGRRELPLLGQMLLLGLAVVLGMSVLTLFEAGYRGGGVRRTLAPVPVILLTIGAAVRVPRFGSADSRQDLALLIVSGSLVGTLACALLATSDLRPRRRTDPSLFD
jgi:hypothetical protein